MKIEKKFKIFALGIIFSLGLCCRQLKAELNLSDVKGSYALLKPGYKHLSPVFGMVWWKNNIIENYYRYGNEAHPTIKLIFEFFYVNPVHNTFNITRAENNPGMHLTPEIVGKIMHILEDQATYDPVKKNEQVGALKNVISEGLAVGGIAQEKVSDDIRDAMEEIRLQLQSVYEQLGTANLEGVSLQSIQDVLNTKKALLTVVKVANIINQAKSRATQKILNDHLLAHEPERTVKERKKRVGELNKAVKDFEKKRLQAEGIEDSFLSELSESIAQESEKTAKEELIIALQERSVQAELDKKLPKQKQSFVKLFDKKVEQLCSLIIDSHLSKDYLPYTTQSILLAYLFAKSEGKEDLKNYFMQISDFMQQQYKGDELQEYSKFDYETLRDQLRLKRGLSPIDVLADEQLMEKALFAAIAGPIYEMKLPPSFPDVESLYQDKKFSDCAESATRYFFNILAKKPGGIFFDTLPLESVIGKLHPSFTAFYSNSETNSIESVANRYTHDAWNEVVSNIPGVGYSRYPNGTESKKPVYTDEDGQGCYELWPSIPHFITMFRYLFPNMQNFELYLTKEKIVISKNEIKKNDKKITKPDEFKPIMSALFDQLSRDDFKLELLDIKQEGKEGGQPIYTIEFRVSDDQNEFEQDFEWYIGPEHSEIVPLDEEEGSKQNKWKKDVAYALLKNWEQYAKRASIAFSIAKDQRVRSALQEFHAYINLVAAHIPQNDIHKTQELVGGIVSMRGLPLLPHWLFMHNMERYKKFYIPAMQVFDVDLKQLFPVFEKHALQAALHGRQDYFIFVLSRMLDKVDIERVKRIIFEIIDKRPRLAADIIDTLVLKGKTDFLMDFIDKALVIAVEQPIMAGEIVNRVTHYRKYIDNQALLAKTEEFIQLIPTHEIAQKGIGKIATMGAELIRIGQRTKSKQGHAAALELFNQALKVRIEQGKKRMPVKALELFRPILNSLRNNLQIEYVQKISEMIVGLADKKRAVALALIDAIIKEYTMLLDKKYKRYEKVARAFSDGIESKFTSKAKEINTILFRYEPKELP